MTLFVMTYVICYNMSGDKMKQWFYQMIIITILTIFLAITNYSIGLVFLTCLFIILTSLNYLFDNLYLKIIYFIITLGTIYLFNQAIFFIPLFIYDLHNKKSYYLSTIIYSLIIVVSNTNIENKIIILSLGFISLYIKYLEQNLQQKKTKYDGLLNNSSLVKNKLKEKNNELIASKNNEIYLATLDERARIAREIHDGVGHLLSSSIIQLSAIKSLNQTNNLTPLLEQLDNSLNIAMDEMRISVHNQHSDSINLKYELEKIITNFKYCKIYLDYNLELTLSSKTKYTIINIVKEALNNTSKHSNASYVKISLKEFQSFIQLIIHDNGTIATQSNFGLGLTSITEQINKLNSTITITNIDGFKMHITINKEMI